MKAVSDRYLLPQREIVADTGQHGLRVEVPQPLVAEPHGDVLTHIGQTALHGLVRALQFGARHAQPLQAERQTYAHKH